MQFAEVREAVFKAKPGCQAVYERDGVRTIYEHAQRSAHFSSAVSTPRREEFLAVFTGEVRRLFSAAAAASVRRLLDESWYISTAEHHGPLTHPFSVSGLVAQAAVNRERGLLVVPVLSCAGISLNNSSFPRGHLFHTASLDEKRLHLLSLHNRHTPVYAVPPYSKYAVRGMAKDVNELRKRGILSPAAAERVEQWVSAVYEPAVNAASYSDQVARTNAALFRRLPGCEDSDIMYLDLEKVVVELLLKYHVNKETPVNHILFSRTGHEAWQKQFDGLPGAFSSADSKGTFLFWGIELGKRVPLRYEAGELVSVRGSVRFELNPVSIGDALKHKKLMPSLALSYTLLSGYYGLTLGGGFSQVDYLPALLSAYRSVLGILQAHQSEVELSQNITADYLSSDYSFLHLSHAEQSVPAAVLDFLLYGNTETAARITERLHSVTLADALDAMMPHYYTIVTKNVIPTSGKSLPPSLYV